MIDEAKKQINVIEQTQKSSGEMSIGIDGLKMLEQAISTAEKKKKQLQIELKRF